MNTALKITGICGRGGESIARLVDETPPLLNEPMQLHAGYLEGRWSNGLGRKECRAPRSHGRPSVRTHNFDLWSWRATSRPPDSLNNPLAREPNLFWRTNQKSKGQGGGQSSPECGGDPSAQVSLCEH